MTKNSELLAKADLAIGDFSTNGGVLLPEQANTFIRKLIKQPTILAQSRVVEMTSPQRNINKIGFGKRILRAGVSAVALDTAAIEGDFDADAEKTARAKPTTEQITLNTKEVIAEIRIPYDVMEDNIERATTANNGASNTGPGGLRNTILDLIVERAALDLEELAILGDTAVVATDPYLGLFDGYLKLAETNGNVSDAVNATISKAIFKAGMKAMPDQYLRNVGTLNHYVSKNQEIEYRDTLADRGTALGDSNVTGARAAIAYGSPVQAVSLMPEDKGLYTNPKNFLFGIQRDMSLEFDKSITERVYIIVLTARVAVQIEETEAVVVYNNIAS